MGPLPGTGASESVVRLLIELILVDEHRSTSTGFYHAILPLPLSLLLNPLSAALWRRRSGRKSSQSLTYGIAQYLWVSVQQVEVVLYQKNVVVALELAYYYIHGIITSLLVDHSIWKSLTLHNRRTCTEVSVVNGLCLYYHSMLVLLEILYFKYIGAGLE